jgi:serine protease Do
LYTKSIGALFVLSAVFIPLLLLQQAGVATCQVDQPVEEESPVTVAEQLSQTFRRVVSKVRPSVVRIASTVDQPFDSISGHKGLPEGKYLPFGEFHKGQPGASPFEKGRKLPERRAGGHGTGVIIAPDGIILTNLHVVDGARTLQVTLDDQRTYTAEIVATDEETDLAVIRIDASGLQPVTFGNSDAVEVGDWVLAIGSPFGLDQTVTAGIISAKGRSAMGLAEYEDFLQTDAPINPGNSGGPLLNLRGEVIGINTAIATQTGEHAGVGFSIPGRLVQRVATSLMTEGRVERGQIGVVIQQLTPQLAESFGFQGQGVLIAQVQPGSTSEQAGLQSGDIVTKFGGRSVQNPSEMRNEVANTKPGTSVEIVLVRDGKEVVVSMQIGRRQSESMADADLGSTPDQRDPVRRLGLIPGGTASSSENPGKPAPAALCVIREIVEGSPAARAGLRAGDMIVAVNGHPLQSFEDLSQYLQQHENPGLLRLLIVRDGHRQFVVLEVTKR